MGGHLGAQVRCLEPADLRHPLVDSVDRFRDDRQRDIACGNARLRQRGFHRRYVDPLHRLVADEAILGGIGRAVLRLGEDIEQVGVDRRRAEQPRHALPRPDDRGRRAVAPVQVLGAAGLCRALLADDDEFAAAGFQRLEQCRDRGAAGAANILCYGRRIDAQRLDDETGHGAVEERRRRRGKDHALERRAGDDRTRGFDTHGQRILVPRRNRATAAAGAAESRPAEFAARHLAVEAQQRQVPRHGFQACLGHRPLLNVDQKLTCKHTVSKHIIFNTPQRTAAPAPSRAWRREATCLI